VNNGYTRTAFSIAFLSLVGCSSSDGNSTSPIGTGGTGTGIAGTGAAAGTGVAGTGVSGTGAFAGTGVFPTAGTLATAGTTAIAAGSGGMSGDEDDAGVAGSGATAGSSGSAGSAGSAGGAGGSGTQNGPAKPPCLKKSSEVVFVGDSYINYAVAHMELSVLVAQRAIKDGALQQGQTYRDYAIPGTALAAANLLGDIPPQFDTAVQADPDIKFVIMDGGGNDVLLDNMQCLAAGSDKNAQCQMVVANTLAAGTTLMKKMASAGVSDIIYFFYPHVPAGGDDINDYALAMLQSSTKALQTPTFGTFVLDLVPIFDGHSDWIYSDGIHANDTGEGVIADNIWKIMKDNCIAQPASSGCCTPD
jgi:hypothetical protein